MCGIAGVYHFKNSQRVEESTLTAMRDTLVHRGPDDAGNYLSPDRKVGLGARRLKILDLTPTGHMPMGASRPNSKFQIPNSKGDVWITYNGEIYNFRDLREELQKLGHSFRSTGDTEVILHAYLAWGTDFVKRLNGMFAFVIWDEEKRMLLAARDHMGIKPFYYAVEKGSFYFGSEIKAILAHPDIKRELNEEGVSHYLTFSSTPAPFTLFRGIKKLPAGHLLTISPDGVLTEREYWNPARNASRSDAGEPATESEYLEEVRALLKDSIRRQMVSDVPFGCFLSGGIDSSVNAALMSEALGRPVETFSVASKGFAHTSEFSYSREVAKRLGARTHEILIDENHLEAYLPHHAYHFDDPNGDHVSIPLYWLAKLARENGVIVVQIGEGSDELFAGYRTYVDAVALYERWWRWLSRLPSPLRKGAFSASTLLRNSRFDFHREYLRRLAANQEPFWGLAVAWSDLQKNELMTPAFKSRIADRSSYEVVEGWYQDLERISSREEFLSRLTYVELKHRLPEFLLARADRMTMAHSVEGRVPFLDTRLVELALHVPAAIKIKGGEPKYLLKRAVEGIIPREIIRRKKQGFWTPMSAWLRPGTKTADMLLSAIRSSELRAEGLLNYEYVEKMAAAHRAHDAASAFRLWNLVTLSLWYDRWFS